MCVCVCVCFVLFFFCLAGGGGGGGGGGEGDVHHLRCPVFTVKNAEPVPHENDFHYRECIGLFVSKF